MKRVLEYPLISRFLRFLKLLDYLDLLSIFPVRRTLRGAATLTKSQDAMLLEAARTKARG